MRIHPVFHISLLEPAPQNAKTQEEITIEEETYEVEKIIAERQTDKGTLYLIKWKGYDGTENTWEPIENLVGAEEALEDFRRKFPTRQREVVQNWRVNRQNPRMLRPTLGIPTALTQSQRQQQQLPY